MNRIPHGTSKTIGSIVRGFKIGVTKYVRQQSPGKKLWQRNYYDRIIRDKNEFDRISKYIKDNPLKWETDSLGQTGCKASNNAILLDDTP